MLPALLGTAFAAFIVDWVFERDRRSLVAALATLGIAAVVSVFV